MVFEKKEYMTDGWNVECRNAMPHLKTMNWGKRKRRDRKKKVKS